jgi:DNA-binding CsgD family transcriptional regulator
VAATDTPGTHLPSIPAEGLDAARFQRGLGALRAIPELRRLLERAPAILCEACGFERAVVFRIDGTEMLAESAFFGEDRHWEAEFLARARQDRPELTHRLLETEMVRRRTPLLVADPRSNERAFAPLVGESRTTAYVAAPIVSGGRVIGSLHADRYYSQTPLSTADLDVLSLFAEAFAAIFERVALSERNVLLRRQLTGLLGSAGMLVNEVCDAPLLLGPTGSSDYGYLPALADGRTSGPSQLEELLTRREHEILALMAEGATNRRIAAALVITEGTVKSHVKRILRKLRAANRAEAVSRYLKLSRPAA